jgi:hypothetical protein
VTTNADGSVPNATNATNVILSTVYGDLGGSRSIGTTYTNSTGHALFINVVLSANTLYMLRAIGYVDSNAVSMLALPAGPSGYQTTATITLIVPNGKTYRIVGVPSNSDIGSFSWFETY